MPPGIRKELLMPSLVPSISALVENLTRQIIAITESTVAERARAALVAALDGSPGRGPGRGKSALAPAGTKPARRAPKATAKLARARKLQGQYLGALRSLGQADRAKVKALAKAKGVAAAVKLAVSLKKPKA
jgi:hypothetical protein